MQEEIKRNAPPTNAAEKIRKILFNFDLELTASLGELSLAQAKIQRYASKKNKRELEFYTSAKIDEVKIETYIEQLTKGKNETYEALEKILETYTPKYKKIWLMYFIGNQTYEEISATTYYSYNNVKKIIKKLKKDLVDYGLLPREEEEDGIIF